MLAGARQWTQHGRPEFFAVWLPSVEHIATQTQWKRSKVRWHRLEEVTTWCQRQGRRLRLQTFNSGGRYSVAQNDDGSSSRSGSSSWKRSTCRRIDRTRSFAIASLFLRREAAVAGLLTDELIFGHRRPVRVLERRRACSCLTRHCPGSREDVVGGRRLRPQQPLTREHVTGHVEDIRRIMIFDLVAGRIVQLRDH